MQWFSSDRGDTGSRALTEGVGSRFRQYVLIEENALLGNDSRPQSALIRRKRH
jgi:hypothetical protein